MNFKNIQSNDFSLSVNGIVLSETEIMVSGENKPHGMIDFLYICTYIYLFIFFN